METRMHENAVLCSIECFPSLQPLVRKAKLTDVADIFHLVNHYADQQIMLPKTHLQLYENLRDYSIVVDAASPSRLLGCGALHIYWQDLAEIRALAVAPEMRGKGIGAAIVEELIKEAQELELQQLFCFTYEPAFFSRFGFIQVEHSVLPLKVYNECFHCPKFTKCDELAMILHL